ncbi:MAG: hypothetical protein ABFE13_22150 [Phycisphaerales bacterium]
MDDFLDDLPDLDLPDPPARRPPHKQKDPDCVLWVPIRCPYCGSGDCPVTNSSHVPIRYHKCRTCGHSFKSVEENWRGEES